MKNFERLLSLLFLIPCLLHEIPAVAGLYPGRVIAWGRDDYGQTDVPLWLSNAVSVAAGSLHNIALTADGLVVAWGYDNVGQTNVPSSAMSNVTAIAAGDRHSLALRSDGTVVAWGYNSYQQTNVPSGLSNVIAVTAGNALSVALKSDGSVVAWGRDNYRQTSIPESAESGVTAIAAGAFHVLALKTNGTVVAWGDNSSGQTNVPPGLSNVMTIAAGYDRSVALKSDGSVVAWGTSAFADQAHVPDSAKSGVVEIAAGEGHSLALKSDWTLVGWGQNDYRQAELPNGVGHVAAIACGPQHSLAIDPSPIIAPEPPLSVCLSPGADFTLSATVQCGIPFGIQWLFNGGAIDGETNAALMIHDFEMSKAGGYSLVASNEFGGDLAPTVLRVNSSAKVLVDDVDVGGGSTTGVDAVQISMSNTGSGRFIYYTLDGSDPDFTDIPYSGAFTLTNTATIRAIAYNAAYTESAEAAPITVVITPSYPLALSTAGGGDIETSPTPYADNRYVSNTVVTVTATPDPGWEFMNWTGDSAHTTNVIKLMMDGPHTLSAVFGTSPDLYTNGNGSLVLDPPVGPYPYGSVVQATALPTPGSYFFGWAGALTGFKSRASLTVTAPTPSITALFAPLEPNQVSLTVLPGGNGTVSVDPARNVYTNGEQVTLTATPGANSRFDHWSGDASGTSNPLVLTLDSSKLISATFVPGSSTNPPVITRSPLSRTLSPGADTLLSLELNGDSPFAYQWRRNGSPLIGGDTTTFALSNVTPANVGLYDVIVSGPGGSATSAPASVALFGMELVPGVGGISPLLKLDAAPGTRYLLEHSSNLVSSTWNLLLPLTLSGEHFYYVDDPLTNHLMRFYRATPE